MRGLRRPCPATFRKIQLLANLLITQFHNLLSPSSPARKPLWTNKTPRSRWAAGVGKRGAERAYFGCGTIRRYGFRAFQPPGKFVFAFSLESEGGMVVS